MAVGKTSGHPIPASLCVIYCLLGLAYILAGLWLANDLGLSRSSIISEKKDLALQTSKVMSQRLNTSILTTDYVLRDITTRIEPGELVSAGSAPEASKRLSRLLENKLSTLPSAMGLGFLDKKSIFVAAADRHLVGIKSNSRLQASAGRTLENRVYVEYVPSAKSANKQPSILVSRPMLSADGEFLGGALAAMGLASFQEWLETFHIASNDSILLMDDQGTLLASNPRQPALIGKALRYPPGTPEMGSREGSTAFVSVSPVDGRKRIYGSSAVDDVPLTILVGFDVDGTLREWRQRAWQVGFGFLILLVLLCVIFSMHLKTIRQRERLRELATIDPLTGIANRRKLTALGEFEIKKALRYSHPASLLMVDIDNFKKINDTWGHPTGDRVIQALANAMVDTLRVTDIVGRIGGEEFVALLTCTDPKGAALLANRLREHIANSVAVESDNGSPVRFTISVGVSGLSEDTPTFEKILMRADQALYEAKNGGRNTVVTA